MPVFTHVQILFLCLHIHITLRLPCGVYDLDLPVEDLSGVECTGKWIIIHVFQLFIWQETGVQLYWLNFVNCFFFLLFPFLMIIIPCINIVYAFAFSFVLFVQAYYLYPQYLQIIGKIGVHLCTIMYMYLVVVFSACIYLSLQIEHVRVYDYC